MLNHPAQLIGSKHALFKIRGMSLLALLEIKGHLEYYLPEESGNDKRVLAYLWRDVLWAIWGTASENGGSKVIKTAPKELKEKYQQVFA